MNSKISVVLDTVEEQGKEIGTLKEVDKHQVKEEVLAETNKQSNLASYKFTLAAQKDRAGENLINHEFKCTYINTEARTLIEGKGDGAKAPSILVTLQNQYQSNEILCFSKSLPKGVSIVRDIPVGYRDVYV